MTIGTESTYLGWKLGPRCACRLFCSRFLRDKLMRLTAVPPHVEYKPNQCVPFRIASKCGSPGLGRTSSTNAEALLGPTLPSATPPMPDHGGTLLPAPGRDLCLIGPDLILHRSTSSLSCTLKQPRLQNGCVCSCACDCSRTLIPARNRASRP